MFTIILDEESFVAKSSNPIDDTMLAQTRSITEDLKEKCLTYNHINSSFKIPSRTIRVIASDNAKGGEWDAQNGIIRLGYSDITNPLAFEVDLFHELMHVMSDSGGSACRSIMEYIGNEYVAHSLTIRDLGDKYLLLLKEDQSQLATNQLVKNIEYFMPIEKLIKKPIEERLKENPYLAFTLMHFLINKAALPLLLVEKRNLSTATNLFDDAFGKFSNLIDYLGIKAMLAKIDSELIEYFGKFDKAQMDDVKLSEESYNQLVRKLHQMFRASGIPTDRDP